jgi:hypothetical protein
MITKYEQKRIVGIMQYESFKTLKTGTDLWQYLISKEQMELDIFRFIEIWYNRKRRHSFRLQNNRRILETENNFKNVA